MTRESMTAMLSETICVTREEARAALEAREWDLLEAGRLLQREARARHAALRGAPASRRERGWSFRGLINHLAAAT